LILGALFFKSSQGAEARGVAFAFLQKTAPGAGQLQQPDGVAGWRGVENDVVVLDRQCRVGQQRCELVEGCNLSRANAGELLFDALDHGIRQNAAHRADDTVTVSLGSRLRIDLQRRQAGNGRNGGDCIADADIKHLAHVGRWISADQQHALSGLRELNGCCAGNRSLAHAAFAGEEEEARRLF
jgi:hypothetical protein